MFAVPLDYIDWGGKKINVIINIYSHELNLNFSIVKSDRKQINRISHQK